MVNLLSGGGGLMGNFLDIFFDVTRRIISIFRQACHGQFFYIFDVIR